VVQKGLRVAKVVAKRSVGGGLIRKTVGVNPPVVLIAGTK
jgi:hypothetical protein